MKVLAAIPCFNEELTIGSVVLKACQHVDEVLVVDDGSSDGTTEVARAAGAHVIRHEKNEGKGAGSGNDRLLKGYFKDPHKVAAKLMYQNAVYYDEGVTYVRN